MTGPAEKADRLAETESRLAFIDDTVEKLADVVARQDRELLELRQQVRALADKMRDIGDRVASDGAGSDNDPPPHY